MGQAAAQSPGYYAARMAVIVLSVLIVVALAALVVGLIYRSRTAPDAAAPATQADYSLPRNAEIVAMQSQPQRVILHLETPEGAEIVILDSGTGRLVRRIRTAP
ncbi:MAG: hypothetical protein BGN82_04225 [Alphaproteobacteria bacterium 65-7]|nr:MAG: hypothetical protein BGN82_04225 [Alphaproteobacteria bacterium 65-7]